MLCNGCVERLDIPAEDNTPRLVVDGMITDQPGPYEVKLFLSLPLNQQEEKITPVKGATVHIIDNVGNSELLNEITDGIYQTQDLVSVTGRTYHLKIITADDKEYESIPAELKPAGTIEDLSFEFQRDVINPNDPFTEQDAFVVSVDGKGPNDDRLLRWRWKGIYYVKTYPHLITKPLPGRGPPVRVPDPLPCSGFITDTLYNMIYVHPCECCECYVYEYNRSALLSPEDVSGNTFNNVMITRIPGTGSRFYEKYYVEVEQMSLDEDTYSFWKLLSLQQNSVGDLFQPNALRVKGNIRSTTNPDERVFGVFSVSGITKKSIFIKRHDHPDAVQTDTVLADCRKYFENSTTVRPPFW
jgi:hypothetical protein